MASGVKRPSSTVVIVAGVVVALFLAGFVSFYASGAPDGLVWTTSEPVPAAGAQEQDHARSDATFSGYSTEGVENDRVSGAIAGAAGVGITLAIGVLLFFAVRAGRRNPAGATGSTSRAKH